MKIAVSSEKPFLEAAIDPRFGRCAYYLIVETDDMRFETIENPNVALGGGAGIQSAQLMSQEGVAYLLTGNCGPNAWKTLEAAGIKVITGCYGIVRDAVESFMAGEFATAQQSNVESHYGMGNEGNPLEMQSPPKRSNMTGGRTGAGMGKSKGGGRGMGGGGGMGMGGERGMGGGGGMGMGGGRGLGGGRGMGGGRGKGMRSGRK